MKKSLILLLVICFSISVFAFEYTPKNTDSNPFGGKLNNQIQKNQKTDQNIQSEMREIKTLSEYFKYLPAEVHRHWTPYKATKDYEICVQFVVNRDGSISDTKIIGTNYPAANSAVLKAVKAGAPYQPLPRSYNKDSVKAQIILEYHANN